MRSRGFRFSLCSMVADISLFFLENMKENKHVEDFQVISCEIPLATQAIPMIV